MEKGCCVCGNDTVEVRSVGSKDKDNKIPLESFCSDCGKVKDRYMFNIVYMNDYINKGEK
jgi:hypothetical protein